MDVLDRRGWALGIGLSLIAVALAVSAQMHDSALAVIFGIGGAGLVVYSVIWDRLAEFGPSGLKLFERVRERTAQRLERQMADSVDHLDEWTATVTHGPAQAAAAIRAAKTPEELADILASIVERPESEGERMERVRKDREAGAKADRYSGRRGNR
jgi:hypothetical protein